MIVPWLVKGGADRCGLDMIRELRLNNPDAEIDVVLTRTNVQSNPWKHKFEKFARVVDLGPSFHECNSSQALLDYLQEFRPAKVIINNSHTAFESLRTIRLILPNAHIACLLHMDLPGAWDFPGTVVEDHQYLDTIFTVSEKLATSLVTQGVPQSKLFSLHWYGFEKNPDPEVFKEDDVRKALQLHDAHCKICLLYTSPSPRD
jgi:hypothetical protein